MSEWSKALEEVLSHYETVKKKAKEVAEQVKVEAEIASKTK